MSDKEWDDLVDPARIALEALITSGDSIADRIEKLEVENKRNYERAKVAETKLTNAAEALNEASFWLYDHTPEDVLKRLFRVYKELKGKTDE